MSGAILRRRDRTARPPRVVHYSSAVNTSTLATFGNREWEASIPFLLWLAHDRACEAELAQQLDELLAADRLPDLKLLEQRFVARLNEVPVVTVDIPGADSYDALFAAQELAA